MTMAPHIKGIDKIITRYLIFLKTLEMVLITATILNMMDNANDNGSKSMLMLIITSTKVVIV